MLIRSQDKTILTQFYSLAVTEDIARVGSRSDPKIVGYNVIVCSPNDAEVVAQYSTRAKAIAVLDMIGDWIIKTKREELCYYIFQMPADEDVEA